LQLTHQKFTVDTPPLAENKQHGLFQSLSKGQDANRGPNYSQL